MRFTHILRTIAAVAALSISSLNTAISSNITNADLRYRILESGINFPIEYSTKTFQDSQKFFWIGTQEGVFKYDGHNSQNIFLKPSNGPSSAAVYDIMEDDQGVIWTATNKGLYKYTPLCDSLEYFKIIDYNNSFQQQPTIKSIAYASDTKIMYCGTPMGLFAFDTKTNVCHQDTVLKHSDINDILIDHNNHLWVTTWGQGVVSIDLDNNAHRWHKLFGQTTIGKKRNCTHSLHLTKKGRLLVGLWVGGFYVLDIDTPKNPRVIRRLSTETYPSLKSDIVYDYVEDSEGRLWLGTSEGVQSVSHLESPEVDVKYYPQLYKDAFSITLSSNNLLWITSKNGGGVQVANINKPLFEGIADESMNLIHNLVKDPEGRCLLMTKEQSVLVIDETTNSLKPLHTISKYANLKLLEHHKITDLHFDKHSNIWISTQHDGVIVYNLQTNRYKFLVRGGEGKNLKLKGIDNLKSDDFGNLWAKGLKKLACIKFDLDGSYKVYRVQMLADNKPINNVITDFCVDRNNVLWISLENIGLFKSKQPVVDPTNIDLVSVVNNSGKAIFASSILKCKDGSLMIGSKNSGILFVSQNGSIVSQVSDLQMPNVICHHMIECENQNFFVTTNYGLLQVQKDKDGYCTMRYNSSDGLISDDLSQAVIVDLSDTTFIIGNKGGVNFVNTSNLNEAVAYPPELQFVDSRQSVCAMSKKPYHLSYKDNNITIEFVALDMLLPEKHIYAYKMSDVDTDWNYCLSDNRKVTYRNLKAGRYTFQVNASNHQGVWSTDPLLLTISVGQNPFTSIFAILLYLSILIFVLVLMMHLNHTRKITASKLALTLLGKENDDQMNSLRMRFYTMVSHDLLGPISMLQTVATQWENLAKNNIEIDKIVEKNISYLYTKVEKILHFQNIEQGALEIKPIKMDITSLLNSHSNSYELIASNKKECDFHIAIAPALMGVIDGDALLVVLNNLIFNALKYTNLGSVSVDVRQEVSDNYRYLKVVVADTGCGMSKIQLQQLNHGCLTFDQPSIGLRIVLDTVKSHMGTIHFDSIDGEGTTATVSLPISESFYVQNNINVLKVTTSNLSIEASELNRPSEIEVEISKQMHKTIALFHQDEHFLQLYSTLLSEYYTVHIFRDSDSLLQYATAHRIDVAILEYNPLNVELIKNMRSLEGVSEQMILITLTSGNDTIARTMAYSLGVDSMLNNYVEYNTLLIRINTLLLKQELLLKTPALVGEESNNEVLDENELEYEDAEAIAFLQKAKDFIIEHLEDSEFSVADLCDYLAMSNSTLYRRFVSLLGFPPNEYIRRVKVEYAANILATHTEYTISEVAYMAGFGNVSYFGVCFKKIMNLTPKEYCNQKRNPRQTTIVNPSSPTQST